MIASAVRSVGASLRTVDNFGITIRRMNETALTAALDRIAPEQCRAPVDSNAVAELKFGECLPEYLAVKVLQDRLSDVGALRVCLQRPRR